jgi:anti-anti-sigma regulatory factor
MTPSQVQPDSDLFCFSCTTDRALGSCRIVVTNGINELNALPLRKRAAIAIDDGQRDVTIDLTTCEFVQRMGYSMLLSIAHHARKVGGSVTIVGASGDVRELFDFYHIADQFRFAASEVR